jgi:hypothetical protein
MNWDKHELILSVIKKLKQNGSWAGKTHVIKSIYLLQSFSNNDKIRFDFILYKHGPYSFELENELAVMKSYQAITSDRLYSEYGESLKPGENENIPKKHYNLESKLQKDIDKVCRLVGQKNVKELEGLATITWIIKNENISDEDAILNRLSKLKPHISAEDGEIAFNEIKKVFLIKNLRKCLNFWPQMDSY